MELFVKIFFRSLGDFLSPQFLRLSMIPFGVSVLLFMSLFWYYSDDFLMWMRGLVGPESDLAAVPIISFIIGSAVVQGVFGFLFQFLLFIPFVYISLFFGIIILGFLTPFVVKGLQAKHYPGMEIRGYGNPMSDVLFILFTAVKMIILFIVLIPTYFIPPFNLISFFLPFYYFFHRMLTRDVSANITDKAEYHRIMNGNWLEILTLTAILYVVSLIPVIGVLAQLFYAIVLAHWFFEKARLIRPA